MGFYAKSFIFNDIPSEYYDMRVFNFESGGLKNSSGGGDIEIIKTDIYRRPVPYLYGTSQRPVLTFPLTFGSFNAVDGTMRSTIEQWLFGKSTYQKLQIVQEDLYDVYFNCFLTNPQPAYIGNLNYAFNCEVVCDAPWAWEFSKTLTKSYDGGGITDDTFTFYNGSNNNDYLYPTTVIALNAVGSDVSIINNTDASRATTFTGLSALETITLDNDRKILTSDTGLRRLSKFNLHWFRLLPGYNSITITGGISSFVMTYQLARKVGG